MMFQHPVTEHLPQDITTELRQRGVEILNLRLILLGMNA